MMENIVTLNHAVRLEFNGVPDEARKVIEPLVIRYQVLLPTWAQLIYIGWNGSGDGKGTTIDCHASYDYRSFTMTFHSGFIVQREDEHKAQMIHEILHASSCVLADWARGTIDLLTPESDVPKFRQALLEELRQRHEAFVQDLALRLVDALP
jgi:hypothetical protein